MTSEAVRVLIEDLIAVCARGDAEGRTCPRRGAVTFCVHCRAASELEFLSHGLVAMEQRARRMGEAADEANQQTIAALIRAKKAESALAEARS